MDGTLATTAAATATAAAAVAEDDNASFMRALPTSLRQAILFDMDHSQISALPEDLATEARTLQQAHHEREIDLFAAAAHRSASRFGAGGGSRMTARMSTSGVRGGTTGLDGIYNVASSLLHDTYIYGGGGSRDLSRLRRGLRQLTDVDFIFPQGSGQVALQGASGSGGAAAAAAAAAALERARNGRQLLDHESLACLLVLLFIDEPRMNMTKLHRVVRNLCIHGPSRAWVIRALLSILEKVSGRQEETLALTQATTVTTTTTTTPVNNNKEKNLKGSKQPIFREYNNSAATSNSPSQPAWFTMAIDGAFGSKTNVFTILRPINTPTPKKTVTSTQSSASKLTPMSTAQPNATLSNDAGASVCASIAVNPQVRLDTIYRFIYF